MLHRKPHARVTVWMFLVLAAAFGTWRVFLYRSDLDNGLNALRLAHSVRRPIQARLSAFTGYAPFDLSRGQNQESNGNIQDLAKLLLLKAVNDHPGPATEDAVGELYLTEKDSDQAIVHLKKAVEGNAKNAQYHSDLAAAYLEKASAAKNSGDLLAAAVQAVENASDAVELQPSLLPANFNQALSLQQLRLLSLAAEAWQDYLIKDPGSEWSQEARRNLITLRAQASDDKTPDQVFEDFLAAYRHHDDAQAWRIESQTKDPIAGVMIPFQLVGRLLVAQLSGRKSEYAELLDALRYAGRLERERAADDYFDELAVFYSTGAKRNELALDQAEKSIALGCQLCLQGRYSDAESSFDEARRLFLSSGDTWETKTAEYLLSYCALVQGKNQSDIAILSDLDHYCYGHHYSWLQSQLSLGHAWASIIEGEHSDEERWARGALKLATAAGDSYLIQKSSCQLASEYSFFNRLDKAIQFLGESLQPQEAYFISQRQALRSLTSASEVFFSLRLYHAAEAFEREALSRNRFSDPVWTFNAYKHLGQIAIGERNYSAAEHYLGICVSAIPSPQTEPANKILLGQYLLQMGDLKREQGDHAGALNYYHEADQLLETGMPVFEYQIRKRILICDLLRKDEAAIQTDLPLALDMFERNRHVIHNQQNRDPFFDTEQDIYDLAINYEYSLNRFEDAFKYAEMSRARSLLDAISHRPVHLDAATGPDMAASTAKQPFDLGELQQQMPDAVQLVEYAVLKDRLLVWLVRKTDYKTYEKEVSAESITSITNEYLYVVTNPDADSTERERQLAARLYDLLFAEVVNSLNTAQEVAIVPDKVLFKLPFVALLSKATGRRVVEQYRLLYAPSATVLVRCSRIATSKGKINENERILSVGDPAFDREQHTDLQRLPSAADEAKDIAALYSDHILLVDRDATRSRVDAALDRVDVIHFASHYLVNAFSRDQSMLLLSSPTRNSEERASALSLGEIEAARLTKPKLAVLAACQSGVEDYYAGEGLIGLSRAFLEAGVPLVVGSQWAVESDSSAKLMTDLQRLRKLHGLSTTEALRQAQCLMLQGNDATLRRPFYWAAFFSIGAHAEY